MIKVIKTESEYDSALEELETLIDIDPDIGTQEADRLELLTLLVQDYEDKQYKIDLPEPIEAIKFRMEQQNLAPRDLIPYLGSRSKVSEILSGSRPLTLSMIRAIHKGLGIPAKVLLQESAGSMENKIDWNRFPLQEMQKRGWIAADSSTSTSQAKEILKTFLAPLGSSDQIVKAVLYRQTNYVRSGRKMDDYALAAWTAQIMLQAINNPPPVKYQQDSVNLEFMRNLSKLSVEDEGPLLAINQLRNIGISVIIEPPLPRTHLDGAAIMYIKESPIIGLSLRFDRLDSFWFTLMHELSHISLHLDQDQFFDDLDLDLEIDEQEDPREKEADDLAREALIPQEVWKTSPASRLPMASAAISLANRLEIHPAIVAGRIRYELKAWRHLNNLVGFKEVHRLFPDRNWS